MASIEDIKEELAELRATFDYYKRSSGRHMEQVKKLLEEAARSEVSAEELRQKIAELEALLRQAERNNAD